MATTVRGDKLGTFKRKAFYLVDPTNLTVRHGSTGRIIDINDLERTEDDVETLLDLLPDTVAYGDGKFCLKTSATAMAPDVRESITTMEPVVGETHETVKGALTESESFSTFEPKPNILIDTHPLSLSTLDGLCNLDVEQVGGYLSTLGKGAARSVRKALRNRGRSDLAAAVRKPHPGIRNNFAA